MLISVDGDSDGIIVPHPISFVYMEPVGVEGLPSLLPCFPHNENIPRTTMVVVLVKLALSFVVFAMAFGFRKLIVIYDLSKFPFAIEGVIVFDVVYNLIVRNNLLILIVDDAFELDAFRVGLSVGEIPINQFNDFGSIAGSILLRGH